MLLAAVVCLLPWPTQIQQTMYAVEISEDGRFHGSRIYEIELEGYKLDFLFLHDLLKLSTFHFDGHSMKTEEFVLLEQDEEHLSAAWNISTDQGEEELRLNVDPGYKRLQLEIGSSSYLASANADLADLFEDGSTFRVNGCLMHGAVIQADGTCIERIQFITDYLTCTTPDGARATINIDFPESFRYDDLILDSSIPINHRVFHDRYLTLQPFLYDSEYGDFVIVWFAFDFREQRFILGWHDQPGMYLVASADPDADLQELITSFNDVIAFYE
jgi:hypothetical protein